MQTNLMPYKQPGLSFSEEDEDIRSEYDQDSIPDFEEDEDMDF